MCGIVGIWDSRGERSIDRGVGRAHERVAAPSRSRRDRRAPGARASALGHKRLSIIDLATGQQPLFNEDGSVVVVFNGEIYNYQELIPELSALGHAFHTRSDTEVIVHAWEQWGEACVERFRGMFAFALWDERRQTLFLARDRLGVKPLYYATAAPTARWLFGSELKSLLAARRPDARHRPAGGRGLLRARLRGRAAHHLPSAQKLPPAHTLCHPPRRAGAGSRAHTGTCASRSATRSAPKTPGRTARAAARERCACA